MKGGKQRTPERVAPSLGWRSRPIEEKGDGGAAGRDFDGSQVNKRREA